MVSKFKMTLALAVAAIPLPVFAALGGDVSSIAADQNQLSATVTQLSAVPLQADVSANNAGGTTLPLPAGVTVQQLTQADGTVIREYIAAGKVFGIAWTAPQPPNLSQLLGNYFQSYVTAVQNASSKGAVHGPLTIQADGLVVHTSGHMNAFRGQAFLLKSLPQGVTGQAIR